MKTTRLRTRGKGLMGFAFASAGLITLASAAPASAAMPDGQDVYVASLIDPHTARFGSAAQTWSKIALPTTAEVVIVSPDATRAYLGTAASGRIHVIDTATGAVIDTIVLGASGPSVGQALALSPDGSRLYSAGADGVLTVVDTDAGTITDSIPLGGGQASSVAVTPDGSKVYVSNFAGNSLSVLDADSLTISATIPMDNDPAGLQVTPDGTKLFIGHTTAPTGGDDVLTVLDTASDTVIDSLTRNEYVGSGPGRFAMSPDGMTVYGGDRENIATIDTSTLAFTKTPRGLPPGQEIQGLALTADGSTVLNMVASPDPTVYALDTSDASLTTDTAPITFGSSLAITPDQAPIARLNVTPGPSGAATTLDASASTALVCPIATYDWDYGDGATETTTVPTTSHVYAAAGSFDANVTLTTSCGTSTTKIFTGQTMLRNGGPTAIASESLQIVDAPVAVTVTLDPINDQGTLLGDSASVSANGSASNGAPVTYSASGLPDGVTIDATTGVMGGTPTAVGAYHVTVIASAAGESAEAAFVWTIHTEEEGDPGTGGPTDPGTGGPTDPETGDPGSGDPAGPEAGGPETGGPATDGDSDARLPETGVSSAMPLFLAAGSLLVVGGAALVVGARRVSRRMR